MSDYSFLLKIYPKTVTKEQFYQVCHIAKKTATYYLEQGLIPCRDSGKRTRRFQIKTKDIVFFLEDRDRNPEKYYLPKHYDNPFLLAKERQKNKAMQENGTQKPWKLKPPNEVADYHVYLEKLFADYPDIITAQHILQVTGLSPAVSKGWCKRAEIRYVFSRGAYYLQKSGVIDYLCSLVKIE
ncbi:MAG: hypothetical protein LBL82_06180 [Oscillospiraceae bacterium]|jgi:hypothetical protein|nr:hypothetical protein [Oscillospiraceae bacterium]